MQQDKKRLLVLGLGTVFMVIIVGLVFFQAKFSGQGLNQNSLTGMFVVLIIATLLIFFLLRRYKDIKQGEPLEDERSKQVMLMAAARAFMITMYWLLSISIFEGFWADLLFNTDKLDAGQAVGGGITGMAVIFFICWVYYNRKGVRL